VGEGVALPGKYVGSSVGETVGINVGDDVGETDTNGNPPFGALVGCL